MATYKQGATLQILLEFTDEEFEAIYPFDSFLAEAEVSGGQEYELDYVVDVSTKTILLSSPTDGWNKGAYKCDIRIVKNGITSFIPPETFIQFNIINPVSETESVVNS